MKPSAMEKWDPRDRGLAEALTLLESTTNRFGIPIDEATDVERSGWWKVSFDQDFTEEAVRDAQKDAPKGATPRVVFDQAGFDARKSRRPPPTQ